MWNGFVEFLLWLARPFRPLHLYRQKVVHEGPPGRDHSLQPSLEKKNDQLQITWCDTAGLAEGFLNNLDQFVTQFGFKVSLYFQVILTKVTI